MIVPRFFAVLALGVLALAAFAGCRAEEVAAPFVTRERPVQGDPRSFLLGFSDVPSVLSEEAYIATFDRAADYGEVLLLQRSPSWADFLPGARVSDAFRDEILSTREAVRLRGLQLLVALDPFDPANRARMHALPPGYAGRTLTDPDLRRAFVDEAVFIARNMRPDFLVLGTEVNATYERNPDAYFAFLEAYQEAYDAVKRESPQTRVFVTFQYEEFLGVVPELPPHAPRWELLAGFGERLDMFGITSYPSFAYPTARKIPPDYYLELRGRTALPVAFVSVGFSSGPGRGGVNASTEPEQRRFLQRLIEDADTMGADVLVWFTAQDLSFTSAAPYDLLQHIGLRDTSDEAKEAWPVWEAASNRPYDPEAAERLRLARVADAEAEATAAAEAADAAAAADDPDDD